jgi:hypothetical protein
MAVICPSGGFVFKEMNMAIIISLILLAKCLFYSIRHNPCTGFKRFDSKAILAIQHPGVILPFWNGIFLILFSRPGKLIINPNVA